jgi:hypothetical protein
MGSEYDLIDDGVQWAKESESHRQATIAAQSWVHLALTPPGSLTYQLAELMVSLSAEYAMPVAIRIEEKELAHLLLVERLMDQRKERVGAEK